MAGINYTLGLQNSGFTSGINGAFASLRNLGGGIARIAAPVAGIAAAFVGLRATVTGVKSAFALGGTLSDLSARTGAAVEDLVLLQQAFRDSGMSADQVGPTINRMQKALTGVTEEGESTSKAFSALGLDMAALKKMGAADQLDTVGAAIRGIEDPAARAAAAMGIFGRGGGEMLALFADAGALGGAGKTIGTQAQILARNAGLFDRISDILDASGQKLSGFFVGVADKIAPVILPLLESFNKIDLAGFGQKIGAAMATIAAAFTSGELLSIVSNSFKVGFMESVNFLWKALRATLAAAGEYISQIFQLAVTYFEILTTPDFWKGMGNAIVGVFLAAVGFLQKGLAEALELAKPLAEIFGKGDAINAGQATLRESAGILDREAAERFGSAGDQLGPLAGKVGDQLAAAGKAIAGRWQDQFAKTADVMDSSAAAAGLDKSFTKIRGIVDAQASAAAAVPAAVAAATPAAGIGEPTAEAARNARQVTADRLRQIGGYVGGGLSAAKDRVAERTEQWTRQTAEAVKKLASRPAPATPAAAF